VRREIGANHPSSRQAVRGFVRPNERAGKQGAASMKSLVLLGALALAAGAALSPELFAG
jgi:hypothetical protein